MRIIDENGIEVVDYDQQTGYLKEDRVFLKHHEAVEGTEEQGHFEVISEYPNGGKDVKWVVDVPAVPSIEAHDEYENVYRFIPYTAKEIARRRVEELKQKLADTDYHILKIVEGVTTLSACAEVIRNRARWRKEINEIEEQDKE